MVHLRDEKDGKAKHHPRFGLSCLSKNGYTDQWHFLDGTWGYETLDFWVFPLFEQPLTGLRGVLLMVVSIETEFNHPTWRTFTIKYRDLNQIQFNHENGVICGWLTITYGRSILKGSPSVILRPTGCLNIGLFHGPVQRSHGTHHINVVNHVVKSCHLSVSYPLKSRIFPLVTTIGQAKIHWNPWYFHWNPLKTIETHFF